MKTYVAHFYLDHEKLKEKTGYIHGEFTEDSIKKVINKILKSGLNFMVKQNIKNDKGEFTNIIYVSSGGFTQR